MAALRAGRALPQRQRADGRRFRERRSACSCAAYCSTSASISSFVTLEFIELGPDRGIVVVLRVLN